MDYVGDDHTAASLDANYAQLTPKELEQIIVVAMDMWRPYIQSTLHRVPEAVRKIAFDKFHVASHLGKAVDDVRRTENKELLADGDGRLKVSVR